MYGTVQVDRYGVQVENVLDTDTAQYAKVEVNRGDNVVNVSSGVS